MSKYDELKAAAEAAHTQVIRSHGWEGTIEDADMLGVDERYMLEANPAAILGLIAENERLTSGTSRLSAKLSRQIVRNRQAFHLIDEMKNAWISVEDRLPQERQAVLAYCIGSESVGVAWLHADGQWLIPEPQALGADCITHWMALPSAPVIAEDAA